MTVLSWAEAIEDVGLKYHGDDSIKIPLTANGG